jgi:uncharacterized protein YcnI
MKRLVLVGLGWLLASSAPAHVVVSPAQAGIGRFQTFTVGVPVEKDAATAGVRLVIPPGLEGVRPNVKPGWKIDVKKAVDGHEVVEIQWSGGSIPPGQRDDFVFNAKVPAAETALAWNAYQVYADGSEVAWDRDPKAEQPKKPDESLDFTRFGPWSQTRLINDLKNAPAPDTQVPLWLSVAAVILSLIAILIAWHRR